MKSPSINKASWILPRSFTTLLLTFWTLSFSFGQLIYTTSEIGDEFAFYHYPGDENFVIGAFSMEYNGIPVNGDRDLFYEDSDGNSEVITGRFIESWLDILEIKNGDHFAFIHFFGELMTDRDTLLVSGLQSFALATVNSNDINLLGKFTSEKLIFQGADFYNDHLWVLVRSNGELKYNELEVYSSEEDALTLMEFDLSMNLLSTQVHNIEGNINIEQLIVEENSWSFLGDFSRQITLDTITLSTETSDSDGIIFEYNFSTESWTYISAVGVFSVRMKARIEIADDEYYVGEYLGNVMINASTLEEPMLNDNVFIYRKSTGGLINIGGENSDQFIGAEVLDNKLLLQLNFVQSLDVDGQSYECIGDICGATLEFDKDMSLTQIWIDESDDIFLSLNSYVSDDVYGFCGQFQGEYEGIMSDQMDWICVERMVGAIIPVERESLQHVYPNPVGDDLNLQGNTINFKSYKIINMLGKNVQEGPLSIVINVIALKSGNYFLILNSGRKQKIFTFNKI